MTVFTRAGAADRWLAFTAVPVPKGSLPAPVGTAFSPTPDAATLKRAEAAADLVEKWWRTGKKKGIAINAESRRVRQAITTYRFEGKEYPRQLEPSKWGEKDERLRIVEVEDGHLVVQTSRLRVTDVSPPGMALRWMEPLDTLNGQSERGPYTQTVMTGVIHLPAESKPRLIGSVLATVLS